MSMYYDTMHDPQPPVDPPEEHYITAKCGCEVYSGGRIFVDTHSNMTYCPDCMRMFIDDLGLSVVAERLGFEPMEV